MSTGAKDSGTLPTAAEFTHGARDMVSTVSEAIFVSDPGRKGLSGVSQAASARVLNEMSTKTSDAISSPFSFGGKAMVGQQQEK